MTAQAFEAILREPDTVVNCSRLHALIKAGNYSGQHLPKVAAQYLDTFCDTAASLDRRRWTGVALTGMLRTSNTVAQRLATSYSQLHRLGFVILDSSEREDLRVIAGLLVRQGLECGIKYDSFWGNPKIRDNAPNFPTGANPKWMQDFQTFLDTLTDLALVDENTEPSIIYPISLVSSDGHAWPRENDGILFALTQSGVLTILVLHHQLHDFQFVDIPLSSICSIKIDPSTIVESQVKDTEYEPYDLRLSLVDGDSHSIDIARCSAKTITFAFRDLDDANEWKDCIEGHQRILEQSPWSLSSPTSPSWPTSLQKHSNQLESIPRQTERSSRERHGASTREVRQSKAGAQRSLRSSFDQRARKPAAGHSSATSDDALQCQSDAHSQAHSKSSPQKEIKESQGKLTKVSKSAKIKALKQLRNNGDDPDFEPDAPHEMGTKSEQKNGIASSQSRSRISKTPKKPVSQKDKGATVSRSRKRAAQEDDTDECVPRKKTTVRKSNVKRKSQNETSNARATKKPRSARSERDSVTAEEPTEIADGESERASQTRLTKRKQASAPTSADPAPLVTVMSNRHPTIRDLKASEKPSTESKTPFKKPEGPVRPGQTPSTPSRPRHAIHASTMSRLQTPAINNSYAEDYARGCMGSSPPITAGATDTIRRHRFTPHDLEILSSNSKPVPASPNAESTAISGIADHEEMAVEKRKGDLQTAQSDPFGHRRSSGKTTSLLRKLTGEDEGSNSSSPRNKSPLSYPRCLDEDDAANHAPLRRPEIAESLLRKAGDATADGSYEAQMTQDLDRSEANTFIEDPVAPGGENVVLLTSQNAIETTDLTDVEASPSLSHAEQDADIISFARHKVVNNAQKLYASSLYFPSSPPGGTPGGRSSSSHSSTSAEDDPITPRGTVPPSSGAEEMEWEASLQPHQRSLHDLLMRTSKQVLRHIVDNETAVTDIANIFNRDGEHVLEMFLRRHEGTYDRVFENMEEQKVSLERELSDTAKRLSRSSKHVARST